MDRLAAVVQETRSPWLVSAARDEVDDLHDRLMEQLPRVENARDAAALAPDMLGGSGPRRYLVLFTTPAEARGLGGMPGNYAELTVDQGRFSITDFGRVSDLERSAQDVGARVGGPADFLAAYGQFGFNKDGAGLVGVASFRNLTMSPDFPAVGDIAQQLYSQVTGKEVDGVILLDPFVLQTLLSYTGGIDLTTVSTQLSADNAVDFLLRDQYAIVQDNTERIDALEEAARKTFDALLAGRIPDPASLGRDLGPLVEERRLLVWAEDPEERELLQRLDLLGAHSRARRRRRMVVGDQQCRR